MKAKSTKLLLAALCGAALGVLAQDKASASNIEVVKFSAPWCGACRQMKPAFDRVSNDFKGQAAFRSVNVDAQKAFADAHKIEALPTVVVFKDGKAVARHTGAMSAFRLRSFVRRNR